eukprot:TRINITY_DN6904_c0_g3_i1.p1 TRINITY_DN6904_c0_g3~~TRINITY_DN6904_c0_g3_i1.p1  ORF type:complete len:390 (+),score=23.62 TRINITY_DN6904_c0_g3_i1:155-1324(+)
MEIFMAKLRITLASHLRSYVFHIPSVSLCDFFSTSVSGYDNKDSSLFTFLRDKLGFSPSQLNNACRHFPKLPRVRSFENAKQMYEFLKESDFTDDQIKMIIVRSPNLITLKPCNIKSKFELLRSLGFSDAEIVHSVVASPRLLSCSLDNTLVPRVQYFQRILHGNDNLVKVLKRNTSILSQRLERNIMPIVKLLLDAGIEGKRMAYLLIRNPRLLNASSCSVKSYIEFVRNMDIEGTSMRFLEALAAVSGVGSFAKMEERFRFLESCGLLKYEVTELFRKHPVALTYSVQKTQNLMEFLVKVVGFPPNIVVSYPNLLGYSLERRIKPRYRVFEYLKGIDPSFDKKKFPPLVIMSTDKFINSYVMSNRHAEALLQIMELKTMKTADAAAT